MIVEGPKWVRNSETGLGNQRSALSACLLRGVGSLNVLYYVPNFLDEAEESMLFDVAPKREICVAPKR